MDENKKNDKEYCVGPVCFHCGKAHSGCGKHVLLRWIIGLSILALTFWMGMKIGELKSFLGFGGYGYGMHGGYFRSMPMMQGFYGQNQELPYQFWTR